MQHFSGLDRLGGGGGLTFLIISKWWARYLIEIKTHSSNKKNVIAQTGQLHSNIYYWTILLVLSFLRKNIFRCLSGA